jgi:hypothetical protein
MTPDDPIAESRRFPIAFGGLNGPFMAALGMSTRRSCVEIDGDTVRVRMGWAFQADIHRRSIVGAERRDGYVWWAYGVHGGGGRWIVNGTGHNIVKVRIDPPARARVIGVRVKLRELWVSLEDPDGFLATIAP